MEIDAIERESQPPEATPAWLMAATLFGAVVFWTVVACAVALGTGYIIAVTTHAIAT